jgi:hypothetical protein
MSDEPLPYNPRYIQAWSALAILLGLVLVGMFAFGDSIMHAGHAVWALLRWLCRGII